MDPLRKLLILGPCSNKLKRAEAAIEEYRQEIDHRKAENYGFASMAAVPYAHIVSRMLLNKRPRGTVVTLAPNPKDIVRHRLPRFTDSCD